MDSRLVRLSEAGAWLKTQRTRARLSVREIAERTGATTQAVYNWEAGRTGVTDESAERLAEILGVDIIEVRRNLGLWVPDDTPPGPADDHAERLRELSERLQAIAEEMERLGVRRRDEDPRRSA